MDESEFWYRNSLRYQKLEAGKTSNPSQGAVLTGSGRGVVGAILILIKLNGHIFVPSRVDPRNG